MPADHVNISFTLEFKRNLRALAKKYRSIRSDIQPLVDQLLAGDFPGDQVPGVSLTIFKVRLKNSNIQKGKRSGYRCIYYLKTHHDIILVTVYSKSEQSDVSTVRLQAILQEMGY
ncbi:type II toxin-antitoxin system RelE/ParE family toxin [Geobacter argillaceus]|uniref:mRNA-degrading endonuclease RelE of RelBE toxin-antitoxin system n=1 Tax=Geobacter argillaceus TaxID=345631 RepID=A0A562V911_9BACT|nr:type II toxin-antitoxin system RelE/ParE family toxin [Geobacter argillaceus]TWJ14288.1 mRNA-degrading endonuclease RelE of RelBE toxin-antitoxin system [Geobacter argillaceus]